MLLPHNSTVIVLRINNIIARFKKFHSSFVFVPPVTVFLMAGGCARFSPSHFYTYISKFLCIIYFL